MTELLKPRIKDDMKQAMRDKKVLQLSTIRLLNAAIQQREIDNQITLDDSAILKVINSMIKQRQDARDQFIKGNRPELADKEQQEIAILSTYLPEPLSDTKVNAAIQKAIRDTNATTMKDMGQVMAVLKPLLEGKTDMRTVSNKIKTQLGG